NTGMFDGVRTKFPRLLPILEETDGSTRVLDAIESGREQLVMPPLVRLVPGVRLLPTRAFETVMDLLGVNQTMDHYTGRTRQLSPSPPARVHNGLRDARKGAVMATTDLVLEGGGAKLPGLIGALQSLTAAGYDFHRIAGTSAGAIVGALSAAGLSADRLAQRV